MSCPIWSIDMVGSLHTKELATILVRSSITDDPPSAFPAQNEETSRKKIRLLHKVESIIMHHGKVTP
jgi:hypothetical protein